MGYCYGYNENGRQVLACDACLRTGGVRKRRCKFKVLGDSHRSQTRFEMDYCPAPAYCAECWKTRKDVHDQCRSGAERSQAEYDAKQARLDAGEHLLISASGSWAEGVPKGMVRATFAANQYQDHKDRLIPQERYEEFRRREIASLEDYDREYFLEDHVQIIPVGF